MRRIRIYRNMHLRRAARSSGEPCFLTSCNRRMAASTSTVGDMVFLEPFKSVSLVDEPCLLPKHDKELDLELVREFDLDITDSGRPRGREASSATASSSLFAHTIEPASVSKMERGLSLTCCRPFALQSVYLEVTEDGESVASVATGELA
jgi:hypothetical protein